MSTGNNANIWSQYRHKFDQLFTISGHFGRHINVTRSKLGKLERAIFSKRL